jgi:hypothetical protein
MTQSNSTTINESELIIIARSKLAVSFSGLNGQLTPIALTSGRDYSLHLKRGAGAFALTGGSATIMSGAIAVLLPGTKARANSGSVVIAFKGAEVIAHKRAVVLQVWPSVQE